MSNRAWAVIGSVAFAATPGAAQPGRPIGGPGPDFDSIPPPPPIANLGSTIRPVVVADDFVEQRGFGSGWSAPFHVSKGLLLFRLSVQTKPVQIGDATPTTDFVVLDRRDRKVIPVTTLGGTWRMTTALVVGDPDSLRVGVRADASAAWQAAFARPRPRRAAGFDLLSGRGTDVTHFVTLPKGELRLTFRAVAASGGAARGRLLGVDGTEVGTIDSDPDGLPQRLEIPRAAIYLFAVDASPDTDWSVRKRSR